MIYSRTFHKVMQIVASLCFAVLVSGCGSASKLELRDAESTFKKAIEEFTDENYLEAQRLFDLIRLQYPTTEVADDAQYYLGEINFKRSEFILAAFNYNMLRRSYPGSEFSKAALYQSALCYCELSPPADRDQDYTRKAITALGEFQAIYPNDTLALEAGKRINELRSKLAQREFITAELYRTMLSNRAAIIYYDAILDEYLDTEFAERAYLGKIESLVTLKRTTEARASIDSYRKRFPNGQFKSDVELILNSLPTK